MDTHSIEPKKHVPLHDDLQAASASTADYSRFMPSVGKRPRHHGKIIAGVLTLILLAAIGSGVYILANHHKKTTPPTKTTHTVATAPATLSVPAKQFTAADTGIVFSYPANWTVNEDTNTSIVTAKSPVVSLVSASNKHVSGMVIMTIYSQNPDLSMFNTGNAVAVLASDKISYTTPSGSQRAQTYISFLQYPATTASGALDGVYVTGDSGYEQGQAIPLVDVQKVSPLVRVTFVQCQNAQCSGTTPALSIASSSWAGDTSLSQPLLKMLASLTFN